MGVAIKFSALALDHYCVESGLNVYEFLQMIQDDSYSIRLSRVDFCVDFIDEDVNVSTIYQNLIDNRIGIFREHINEKTGKVSYRKVDMQYQGFIKGKEVPTIYLGAPASMSRLRIYDKKQEQIDRNGSKLDIAQQCKDWVRFEGIFRHEYSHQLTDELLKINNDDKFSNLIACTMIQKFRLMYIDNGVVDCDTEYSQTLLDSINNKSFVLKAPSSKNYEIVKSLIHLFCGSGVISTLNKIKTIWGDDAILVVLKFIEEYLGKWSQNDDCRYWIDRNKENYRRNHPDFDKFFNDNVASRLIKEKGISRKGAFKR